MPRRRKPDLARHLGTLKDFQRRTADYAFRRLYLDDDQTHRFLVADEVGLGKTLVARGVIAHAIEHLWDRVKRIDIVYICSNADIARQNVNRLDLRLEGQVASVFATRMTLLPTKIRDLQKNKVNFISFTPGTSFDLKSSLGTADERALIYVLVRDAWRLKGVGPLKVMRGFAGVKSFESQVRQFERDEAGIDKSLWRAFKRELRKRPQLRKEFEALSRTFRHDRKGPPPEEAARRAKLVGELRALLAATCIEALEPDLIILDEFQRFKHLLHGESDAAKLAQRLFEFEGKGSHARVLLLSATPYKMYTLTHESSEDNHYTDLLDTLRFLSMDRAATELEDLLKRYRHGLYRLVEDWDAAVSELHHLRSELEGRLRAVMSRTERLGGGDDRNGMLQQVPETNLSVEPADIRSYLTLEAVAATVKQEGNLEYWKAAPYLLDLMDDHYKLKSEVVKAMEDPQRRAVIAALASASDGFLLPWADFGRYLEIEPSHPRLRSLIHDVIDPGAWRLLWMPPSLPYYRLAGQFADPALRRLTKRLIFSGWHVVPKAVAALMSYEAERRMIRLTEDDDANPPENSPEARRRRSPLLRFAREADERLSGMPVLTMLYPSSVLARVGDPMHIAAESRSEPGGTRLPGSTEVLEEVAGRVRELLASLGTQHDKSVAPVDERWYWAAGIVLDGREDPEATRTWFNRAGLPGIWSNEAAEEDDGEESRWADHVREAARVVSGELQLGAFPDDLPAVLALQAVASPGTCALRALSRFHASGSATFSPEVRDAAAKVAWSFRSLLNQPETMSLLRGTSESDAPYWRRVLEYCSEGCLQAVLDEYVHVLRDSLGLIGREPDDAALEVAQAVRSAVTIRATNVFADDFQAGLPGGDIPSRGMRSRFALRFGDSRSEDGKVLARSTQVRDAFNSPFWPFVLVTTSVGQEGLDFHQYCHAVVHWDLPSNPVDLEQREGRVHRYKGHAVRKNVASRHGSVALGLEGTGGASVDPWSLLFDLAGRDRRPGDTEIVPYWVYPIAGGAVIERHVPALPLSRDVDHLAALRRSLAVYRMVFGQPRQDDLLEYLLERLPVEKVKSLLDQLMVNLSPFWETT